MRPNARPWLHLGKILKMSISVSTLLCVYVCYNVLYIKLFAVYRVQQKNNPMPYLVDIPTTNLNFYKKIYTAILQSYLHIANYIILSHHLTKLCYLNRDNPTFYNLIILCLRYLLFETKKLSTSVKATSSVTLQQRKFIWQTNV